MKQPQLEGYCCSKLEIEEQKTSEKKKTPKTIIPALTQKSLCSRAQQTVPSSSRKGIETSPQDGLFEIDVRFVWHQIETEQCPAVELDTGLRLWATGRDSREDISVFPTPI